MANEKCSVRGTVKEINFSSAKVLQNMSWSMFVYCDVALLFQSLNRIMFFIQKLV